MSGKLFFFICFSLVLSIIHPSSWTLLSAYHAYFYSPRTGVWHLGEDEARKKISQTGIMLKDDWINFHLPEILWKTAVSLGCQSTFFLSNLGVSLTKVWVGPSENLVILSYGSTDGWFPFYLQPAVPTALGKSFHRTSFCGQLWSKQSLVIRWSC